MKRSRRTSREVEPPLPAYRAGRLEEAAAGRDPMRLFARWLAEANASGFIEPAAMALATVSRGGRPSCRMVLLRGLDRRGFVLYTNYSSRKGRELEARPWAALTFWWDRLGRQARIEGRVEKVTAAESDAYFRRRPRQHQLAAWASAQSRVIAGREVLDRRLEATARRFDGVDVPRPPHWGGLRVVPSVIELWQGRPNRLHDRLRYRRLAGGKWKRERLSP